MEKHKYKLKITWHNDYTTHHEGTWECLMDILLRSQENLSYRHHLWL